MGAAVLSLSAAYFITSQSSNENELKVVEAPKKEGSIEMNQANNDYKQHESNRCKTVSKSIKCKKN